MKRASCFIIVSILLVFLLLPSIAAAQPDRSVQLSQRILPPNCYDTINKNANSTDYIAVWQCDNQP